MSRHVVAHPDKGDWLRDVSSCDNCVQGEISDSDVDVMHVQQDDISDRRKQAATDDEGKTATNLVADDGTCESTNHGEDEDGDGHDLRVDGGPS